MLDSLDNNPSFLLEYVVGSLNSNLYFLLKYVSDFFCDTLSFLVYNTSDGEGENICTGITSNVNLQSFPPREMKNNSKINR